MVGRRLISQHNIHTHNNIIIATLYTTGLRFTTDQSQPVPLLAADSAQEEEDESYEMESMAMEPRFGKGWRWTTEV